MKGLLKNPVEIAEIFIADRHADIQDGQNLKRELYCARISVNFQNGEGVYETCVHRGYSQMKMKRSI